MRFGSIHARRRRRRAPPLHSIGNRRWLNFPSRQNERSELKEVLPGWFGAGDSRLHAASLPLDDYELMAGIAARDETALRALYDRHSPLLFSVCLRVIKDRGEAEDILIDLFWEVWEKASRFDPGRGSPMTYLLTLARSRAIDRLRRKPHEKTGAARLDGDGSLSSPLGDCIDHEHVDAVRAAIKQLDPTQRQAIECAFYDGLSHTEIADKLSKPLGTVKTSIRQGLIRLRESLRIVYRSTKS